MNSSTRTLEFASNCTQSIATNDNLINTKTCILTYWNFRNLPMHTSKFHTDLPIVGTSAIITLRMLFATLQQHKITILKDNINEKQ